MIERVLRFSKKVFSGQHPIKIKYSKHEWDAQYKKGNWNFLLESPQNNVAVIVGMLNDLARQKKRKLKILDIGCGNGSLARNLADESFEYTGIDISSEAIEQAKKNASHGIFIQSSMDDPSPTTEKFDIIIFSEVLLYVDYEKTIKNFRSNLLEEGFLIISLYDVWRTRIIWRYITKQMTTLNLVFIKNKTRNVGWTVRLGKLR